MMLKEFACAKKCKRTDLDERERNLGVPLLGTFEDEVVERLADLAANQKAIRP